MSSVVTRISGDWLNELAIVDVIYQIRGLEAVAEHLRHKPMKTYEKRMAVLIERGQQYSNYVETIKAEYSINDSNRRLVRGLDTTVTLLNLAAVQGRLDDQMYHAFYDHFILLVRGKHESYGITK